MIFYSTFRRCRRKEELRKQQKEKKGEEKEKRKPVSVQYKSKMFCKTLSQVEMC